MRAQEQTAPRRRVKRAVRWFGILIAATGFLAVTPTPAAAQFLEFMDWLDRLSGPGPFKPTYPLVPSVSIPIGCITEATTRAGLTESGVRDALGVGGAPLGPQAREALKAKFPSETTRHRFELVPQCLGLFGVVRAAQGEAVPWGALPAPNGDAIIRKKNRVGFELNFARLSSAANELEGYPPGLSEEAKQVEIFIWGIALRYFPYDFTFIKLAWNRHRFYSESDLFEPFTRGAGVIELGFKPLYWGHKWGKPLTVSGGWRQGLGLFTASNFGATGPYRARDEWTPTLRIGYDIWWIPCVQGLCDTR